MQGVFGFALPQTTWVAPDLGSLPSWAEAKRVAIDFETRDDQLHLMGPGTRRGGYVVGVAFAIDDGPAHYLPMRHEAGGNLDPDHVLAYVRDQAKAFRGELAAAQAQYEMDYSMALGIDWRPSRWRDPQNAAPLINEHHFTYGLDAILKREGFAGKNEETLVKAAQAFGLHPKRQLWKLHAKYVGDYAEGDVRDLWPLLDKQVEQLVAEDLLEAWELECKLQPVLAKMRWRGMRINLDEVDAIERRAYSVAAEMMDVFSRETGTRLTAGDVDKAAALGPAIERLGIKLERHRGKEDEEGNEVKAGGYKIDKALFRDYSDEAERVDENGKMLELRKAANKAHVAAIAALRRAREAIDIAGWARSRKEHAIDHGNGEYRIHPTYNQLKTSKDETSEKGDKSKGTISARVSSDNPNDQQVPTRSAEWGLRCRRCYKADRGKRFRSGDFSQQEPRAWVHYAVLLHRLGVPGMDGAEEFCARWKANPKLSFHKMTAAICGLSSTDAKNCGLGLGYGMGGGKMCSYWLGKPTVIKSFTARDGQYVEYVAAGPEGQEIIDKYFAGMPFLKRLIKFCQEEAAAKGYLRLGDADKRRFRFEWKFDPRRGKMGWDKIHAALNRISQGRGAVQTKRSIVAMDEAGCEVQATVHDEINWSDDDDDRAMAHAKVMRDTDVLLTGNRVGYEVGDNWGETETVELN